MKRVAKPYTSCKYYKSTGAPFGACKHPKTFSACTYHSIDECHLSERKRPLKNK